MKINILKEKLREQGYKLEYVSEILKNKYDIHIDRSNISRYLNGTVKKMQPNVIKGICEIVGIDYIPLFKELGFLDKKQELNQMSEYFIPFFPNIKVAAGRGKLNWDYSTTKFKIGEKFSKAGYVACTVEGDSMVPDIVEGDILILDTKEPSNVNGKIFVVNYNGEVYLKEIYIEGDAVVLHSKNGSYKPIIVTDKSKLHIVGKVMAIYREY